MRDFLASVGATARTCADWLAREGEWRFSRVGGDTSIGRCLLELGLDVRKLPPQSRARLRLDTASVADEPRGASSPRRTAFRFFAWYVMLGPDFTAKALRGEGAVAGALSVVQSWCQTDPELAKWAAPDFHRLRAHLYHGPNSPPLVAVGPARGLDITSGRG